VIIISSKEKYALEAFEYSVTDYLLKPISYARFFKAASKAQEVFDKKPVATEGDNEIFIKKSSSLVKINYDEIMWVEALENYVVIVTNAEKYTIHFTMKSIESQLPAAKFKRVHRSFIVNISHILSIEDNSVVVKTAEGKRAIPIGKSYRDKLLSDLNLMNR
jgi:DNA-binding LytR/AlgR family response regulator